MHGSGRLDSVAATPSEANTLPGEGSAATVRILTGRDMSTGEENVYPKKPTPRCVACPLHKKCSSVCIRTANPIPGADVMIFGDAPGKDEDETGRNFVGDPGRKLNYLLVKSKLKRKDVPIANVGRCKPPSKTPTKTILKACWPYTLHDILTIRPKVIVAMGSAAFQMLAPKPKGGIKVWAGFPSQETFGFTNLAGQRFEHTCWVIPTRHPSEALRDWSLDAQIIRDLRVAKRYAAGEIVYKTPETKVVVLRTLQDVLGFLRRLRQQRGFVLDLETTSLDAHTGSILCIGFCYRKGHATILPLRQQHNQPIWSHYELEQILNALTEALIHATEETPDVEVWGQNIKFDVQWMRKLLGLVNFNVRDDTMLLHHVVDENKPHNLTFMCQWYLKWDKYDAMNYPYYEGGEFKAELVPNNIMWRYCGFDCDGTFQLREILRAKMLASQLQVVYGKELDLVNPLADAEYRGVRVDVEELRIAAKEYGKKVEETQGKLVRFAERYLVDLKAVEHNRALLEWKKVKHRWRGEHEAKEKHYEEAMVAWENEHKAQLEMWEEDLSGWKLAAPADRGDKPRKPKSTGKPRRPRIVKEPTKPQPWNPAENFNPASSRDLAELLKATGGRLDKETTTGLPSTDAVVLAKLATKKNAAGRVAQLIRDLRNYQNNKSKNLDGKPEENGAGGLMRYVSPQGRCHTSYNVTRAVSGRLSSSDPNLQNVPRIGPFRGLFKADSDDHVFLAVDYEKIELCVLAWLSSDPIMSEELIAGKDLHTRMAVTVKLWHLPTEAEYQELKPTITKNQRVIAKGVNFGVPYGRSAYGIVESKENQDAFPVDMDRDERIRMVEDVLEMYWTKYNGVKVWRDGWVKLLHKHGHVKTTDGRIRHMDPGLAWLASPMAKATYKYRMELGDLERAAVNFPIQGFANSILQAATRRVYNGIKTKVTPTLRIMMTIHDALNFSVHRRYVEEAEHYIPIWMNTVLPAGRKNKYELPMKVEVLRQAKWGEEYNPGIH